MSEQYTIMLLTNFAKELRKAGYLRQEVDDYSMSFTLYAVANALTEALEYKPEPERPLPEPPQ